MKRNQVFDSTLTLHSVQVATPASLDEEVSKAGKSLQVIAPNPLSEGFQVNFSEYGFVRLQGLDRLNPDISNLLDARGCFKLPKHPLLVELLRVYLLYAHAEFAIFDEVELWELFQRPQAPTGSGEPTISLFTLHAILSIACLVSELLTNYHGR